MSTLPILIHHFHGATGCFRDGTAPGKETLCSGLSPPRCRERMGPSDAGADLRPSTPTRPQLQVSATTSKLYVSKLETYSPINGLIQFSMFCFVLSLGINYSPFPCRNSL